MSLLEKYLEGKEEMHAKFDEIHKHANEAIDAVDNEFLENFKTMIAEASEEDFHEFLCKSGDKLDEIERMAALTARLEAFEKKCKNEQNKEHEDESKKNDGPHVVIIGIG